MNVAIVGAGLGGLACAIALRKQGINVRVYERSLDFSPVGGSLALFPNGLNFLELIDFNLVETINNSGCCPSKIVRKNIAGETISSSSTNPLKEKYGQSIVTIWWWHLQQALVSQLPRNIIHLDRQCIGFVQNESEVKIHFAGGETTSADLLIGADGINSAVRSTLVGAEQPRYLNSMAWRAILKCEQDVLNLDEIVRIVSDQQFLFLINVGDGYISWTTRKFAPKYRSSSNDKEKKERILQDLTNWAEPFRNLITITPPEKIFESRICDRLPLDSWSKGRVTLLGDAAHSMSPTVGQGANSSFEDAWVLAQCLTRFPTIGSALEEYERERTERTKIMQIKSAESESNLWKTDRSISLISQQSSSFEGNFTDWLYEYQAFAT